MEETEMVDIDYDGDVIAETPDAWYLSTENGEVWFPKSECEIDEGARTICVPEWLAMEEGLI